VKHYQYHIDDYSALPETAGVVELAGACGGGGGCCSGSGGGRGGGGGGGRNCV